MKRTVLIICTILFINNGLFAQKYEPVTVKAGTSLKDYFPMAERYLYPNFTEGKGYFKSGRSIPLLLNLNVLSGEIEFLQSKDTLIIAKKEEINSIVVAKDTFYYRDAYLQKIRNGPVSVYLKRKLVIKDIRKQGGMGPENRSSSVDSYSSLLYNFGKLSVNLVIAEDMVVQKTLEYFFSTDGIEFVPFTRKNILRVVPRKENEIKYYIKTHDIDFQAGDDLLKLADFVSNLLSESSKK